jgi:outer membrane protein OmpA-like peptidoglycan-associated protein
MNRSTPWIAKIPSAAAALTVAWVQIAQAQPTGAAASGASSAAGPTESPPPTSNASPTSTATSTSTPTSPGDDDDRWPRPVAAAQDEPDRSEWAKRDRAANESNTVTGGVGLLRTQHAESGAPGQFRIGLAVEWFSAGFLCTSAFPCQNPRGGPRLTSDTLSHFGGTLSLGASIAEIGPGTLEGYASTTSYANSDTANDPALLQVLGDTNLAVKYVAPLGDVMRMGGFTELWLINGSGSVGLDGGGTGAKFGALATADLRGLSSPVPLRFSLNVVYSLDNTGSVLAATEAALKTPVPRIERYGLGVNRVDHVDILLGGEGLLVDERVRPFVEAHVLIADNRQRYRCHQDNANGDNCLKFDGDGESTLTIGSRFMPWKRGFSVLAALDIGLTGTANFVEELQPVPPWTLFIGGGWTVDTWERPPVVETIEKSVDRGPPTVHVVGFVHEKDKNDPVAGAIATYRDHMDLTPIATGPDGRFSDDVPAGSYSYEIRADGYKPATCDVDATKPAPVSPAQGRAHVDIDCPMEATPRAGTVLGVVRDADTGQALGGIPIGVADLQHKELRFVTDAGGGFRFDGLAPGVGALSVIAEGYLALVTPVDVKARQETTIDLLLRPQPKHPGVVVTAKEITIRDQIQFALDSAVILPDSFGILTEVADTLIRHGEIKRLEVQGHTDNSGTPEHNRVLSDERATAVRSWLTAHGIAPERLVARGYGQDQPLVPNVTASDRARNRRVQFIIVERESASPPTIPLTPPAVAPPSPPAPKPEPLPGF